jgi:glycosyltransferase involved in cell wall biosynthesis
MISKKSSASKGSIVCLVINDLATDQRMQRICSTLSHAGYSVTLVGRKLPDSPDLSDQSFRQVRLQCFINKGFLFYAEYNIRLCLWLLFNWFDVVCAVDLDTIIPAWLLARMKGGKVVYDAHEWFPECPEIVDRPWVYRFWTWVERTFIVRVDAVYTVSRSIADIFSRKYGIKVGLVRNMPQKSEINTTTKGDYILYQGALNTGRGLEPLISAMKNVERELWIAGNGDIEDTLHQLTNSMGLQKKFKFLGRLSPEQLRNITQQAWLGINILENRGMNYYYSLANKFFDYVQAGVPQLSMAFPEYQTMNYEFEVAVLLPDIQESTIVSAIRLLEQNPEKYRHLQENCIQAARHWTWENESRALIKIYDELEG